MSNTHARLAQSVEHQTFNLRVMGSSPLSGDYNSNPTYLISQTCGNLISKLYRSNTFFTCLQKCGWMSKLWLAISPEPNGFVNFQSYRWKTPIILSVISRVWAPSLPTRSPRWRETSGRIFWIFSAFLNTAHLFVTYNLKIYLRRYTIYHGGLAQMVERSLSMREVPGSMPGSSSWDYLFSAFKVW